MDDAFENVGEAGGNPVTSEHRHGGENIEKALIFLIFPVTMFILS